MGNERRVDRFDQYLDYKHLSDNKVTVQLGLSNGVIGKSRKEGRDLSTRVIEQILNFYKDLNPNWLLYGEGEMLFPSTKGKIPLYDDVASVGGYNEIVANVDDQYRMTEYIDAGDWFPSATSAIHHYGDSMVEYPSGCILALKRVNDPRLLINGENYVIETDEFRITKQIQDDGGDYIMAYSSNRETYPDGHLIHSPIKIPKDSIRHLDLVLGCVIKKFSNPVRIK